MRKTGAGAEMVVAEEPEMVAAKVRRRHLMVQTIRQTILTILIELQQMISHVFQDRYFGADGAIGVAARKSANVVKRSANPNFVLNNKKQT
jgi:hypothetical protein